jgi:hypothetical protein
MRRQTGAVDRDKNKLEAKAVPLHATKARGGRGSIALIHSRPRD